MTVDELRASMDALSARGFGGATVVVVRDGKEVTWEPEGGVFPCLVAEGSTTVIEFSQVEDDVDAEGDDRQLCVAIG